MRFLSPGKTSVALLIDEIERLENFDETMIGFQSVKGRLDLNVYQASGPLTYRLKQKSKRFIRFPKATMDASETDWRYIAMLVEAIHPLYCCLAFFSIAAPGMEAP